MTTQGRIFTIGHGGQTWDAVATLLSRIGVEFLIDVRSVPYSKHQPEFTRERLQTLAKAAPRYVFMGDLLGGRPNDPDCYTDGFVDYQKTRLKDFFVRGIDRLLSAYQQGYCVCLLCSEAKPSSCHRSKLIGTALADKGIEVFHLLPDGTERPQAVVMREVTGGQESLFCDHLRSRKTYEPR